MFSSLVCTDDVQQRPPVAICRQCQGEIWHNEAVFNWNGRWMCLDCFKDHVRAMLEDDPTLLALEMGVDVERYT